MTELVWDVIRRRANGNGTPGQYDDGCRLALAVEGGGSRGTYSSGMATELERRGLTRVFDDVYGSSMGAIVAAWLVAGQAQYGIPFWWHPQVMPNVVRPHALLFGRRPVVDLEFLMDTVYQEWARLDFGAIAADAARLHPIATDAETGEVVDLRSFLQDTTSIKLALRASAGLPILAGPAIRLGGRRLLDGGLIEPIPYRRALADGATHVLVLRTRRRDEAPRQPLLVEDLIVTAYLSRVAPGALPAWRNRPARRILDEDELAVAPPERMVQVLVPPGSPTLTRLAADRPRLRRAVELGEQAMAAALSGVCATQES